MRRNEKYTAGTLGHSLSGTASRPCTTAFGSWKASSDSPYGISMANRFCRAATSGQPMMLIGVPPPPPPLPPPPPPPGADLRGPPVGPAVHCGGVGGGLRGRRCGGERRGPARRGGAEQAERT